MTATRPIRLGFYTGRNAVVDGDEVWVDTGVGVLVNALHDAFPDLRMAATAPPERLESHNMQLTLAPDRIRSLPYMSSLMKGTLHTVPARRVMREMEADCDLLVVQLAFQAPLALLRPRRPRLYHVFGDVAGVARTSGAYGGPLRLPAMAMAEGFHRLQRHLVQAPDARVVTNGQELLDHYPKAHGRPLISSTLPDADVDSVARSRPADAPFRVLFCGYFRPEKGLHHLLEAFAKILVDVPDAELLIVGPGTIAQLGPETEALLAALPTDRVTVQGPIWDRTELYQTFADSDVMVLPSLGGEGTPRVLVEARAFRCPVVATTVGGVPSSVTDDVDGILIPPGDVDAIVRAVTSIARDEPRRRRLVDGGLERAHNSTTERFARDVVEELLILAETSGLRT